MTLQERGGILVVSLWMLVVLSLLAVGLSYRMGLELRLTAYQRDEVRLAQVAKAGVAAAAAEVAREGAPYTALNQPWRRNADLFQNRPVLDGRVTFDQGVGEGTIDSHSGLADEDSRINLNFASEETIQRLFRPDVGVADAVLDWRDPDHHPRARGAEEATYQKRALPHQCRNGLFRSVEELLLVQGVTPMIYSRVQGWVTVHGSGKVNINTAPPAVLEMLGAPEKMVEKIERYRRGRDGVWGTGDDGVFKNLAAAADFLGPDDADAPRLWALVQSGLLTVKSEAFRVRLLSALDGSRSRRWFTVVFTPFAAAPLIYWSEE